jgi:hypothetical protein
MGTATFTIDPALLDGIHALRHHPLCEYHCGDIAKVAELCLMVGMLELSSGASSSALPPKLHVNDDTWWLTLRLPPDDAGRREAIRTLMLDLLNVVNIAGREGEAPISGPILQLIDFCDPPRPLGRTAQGGGR